MTTMRSIYQCQICNKVLSRSTTLRAHVRIHTGERPFICSTCGRSSRTHWDLQQHCKTHGAARKYVCGSNDSLHSGCAARFLRKRDLLRHHKSLKGSKCTLVGPSSPPRDDVPPIIAEPQKESTDYSNGLASERCDEELSPVGDPDAQINGLDDTEMQLLEDDDIFALSDEANDAANIAEAKGSLDNKILPFFVETSSFYRLVLALYRIARLITQQHTIERDVDCLEIRAGAFAELQSSASSAACSALVPYDSFLSIIIAVIMETLLRIGDDHTQSVHIATLSFSIPYTATSHQSGIYARMTPIHSAFHATAPTLEAFVEMVIVGARSCMYGFFTASDFAYKLASAMFHVGPSLDIPNLVAHSVLYWPVKATERSSLPTLPITGTNILASFSPSGDQSIGYRRLDPHNQRVYSSLCSDSPQKSRHIHLDPMEVYSPSAHHEPLSSVAVSDVTSLHHQVCDSNPSARILASSLLKSSSITMNDSENRARGTEAPTAQQWSDHKHEIQELYARKPLKEIRALLERRHGFRATERMFKSRLSAWGWHRKSRDREYQICAILHKMRKQNGRTDSLFIINGHRLSLRDLGKYIKGRKMPEDEFVALSEESLDKEQILSQHGIRAITPPVPEEVEDDEARPDESTIISRSSTITSEPTMRQASRVGSTPWHDSPQTSPLPTWLPSTSLRPWTL